MWEDRVFLTTAVSDKADPEFTTVNHRVRASADDRSTQSWRVYCLDRSSGKILWDRLSTRGVPKVQRHPKGSHASSTPATDGTHLVAYFGSEGLYCYDYEGTLLWSQDLGVIDAGPFELPEFQWGVASSPIIFENMVIVQCDRQKDSFLVAFDVETGKRVWTASREAYPSWSTPTVVPAGTGPILVTSGTKRMRAYDPRNGSEIWTLHGTSLISVPTPVFTKELIFVASGYKRYMQPIYAVRHSARGEITLNQEETASEHIAWSMRQGAPYIPTPIVYQNYFYVCSNNGVLSCYWAQTGERVYRKRVASQGGGYSGSPVAGDGRLYFPSEDGEIHVVSAGPDYELLASNPMGEVVMTTPAISKKRMIIRTRHHVFAVGSGAPQSN